jgi:hypothetical protein
MARPGKMKKTVRAPGGINYLKRKKTEISPSLLYYRW